MSYKNTKSLDEMIEYLGSNKKIDFVKISKEEAKDILFRNNYVNVITPFKHNFAKVHKGNKDVFKNSEGFHVYEERVDFSEYVAHYIKERKTYTLIRDNLDVFETRFKSTVSHTILNYKKFIGEEIRNREDFKMFISIIQLKARMHPLVGKSYTISNIDRWHNKMNELIEKQSNLFVIFDCLNLGLWDILLAGLDDSLAVKVFENIKANDLNLSASNMSDFITRFHMLREIRNCVAHSNSMTVLSRYRNSRETKLREDKERKKYQKMWEELQIEGRWVDIYSK